MKEWKALTISRRVFYLAVVILPLAGILLHVAVGGLSLPYLIPLALCLLLGAGNLLLAVRGRLPQKLPGLWHLLLVISLLIAVYLTWMMAGIILWIYTRH